MLIAMRQHRRPQSAGESPATTSLDRFVRRRRWKRVGLTLAVLGLLGALSVADHRGWFLYQGGDFRRFDDQAVEVLRVIDGDTFDVAIPDGDKRYTRIRLWGVDTPEIQSQYRDAEPFGDEASARTKQLLEGQRVVLDLEPYRVRGTFGRVLAYVKLEDGTVLNERLLLEGLARVDERWPHRAMERYVLLEEEARKSRLGVWQK